MIPPNAMLRYRARRLCMMLKKRSCSKSLTTHFGFSYYVYTVSTSHWLNFAKKQEPKFNHPNESGKNHVKFG